MQDQVPNYEHPLTLPTVRLLLIAAIVGPMVGTVWAVAAWLVGSERAHVWGSLLAGVASGLAGVLAIVLIGPWQARPLIRWPFIFLLGTMIQLVATLGGGILLYFATPFRAVSTWLCLVVSFWAVLFGLVRAYGSHVKRYGSARPSVAAEEGSSSAGHQAE